MNFKPELVEKILAGEKTQTRRRMSENPRSPWYSGGCSLKVNHAYALCPGRGKVQVGKIAVHDVRGLLLGDLTFEDARAEGFAHPMGFANYWAAMHGAYVVMERVWAITFSLIHPDDYGLWEGGL